MNSITLISRFTSLLSLIINMSEKFMFFFTFYFVLLALAR